MNTRHVILAAIGGAALVAIPTTVAVAATHTDDTRMGMGTGVDYEAQVLSDSEVSSITGR